MNKCRVYSYLNPAMDKQFSEWVKTQGITKSTAMRILIQKEMVKWENLKAKKKK